VSDRKSQISKGTLRLAELLEASAARAGASS
jgi:hypothetical protein